MNCPEKAGAKCADHEACMTGFPCELVRQAHGLTMTDRETDAVTAELVRLTLGERGPERPELIMRDGGHL